MDYTLSINFFFIKKKSISNFLIDLILNLFEFVINFFVQFLIEDIFVT